MHRIRAFIHRQSAAMALLFAVALAMRALVPSGYMVMPTAISFSVALCSGVDGEQTQITIPTDGESGKKDGGQSPVCSASQLDHAGMGAVAPILLATALAFILALGFTTVRQALPPAPRYLHPPLRGPPLPT
jgi:hypothetical protein